LTKEPLATAQTTGSSRSARTPDTCWAFSARSSPSTPAVFFAAASVSSATSSRTVAMSSSSASRLPAAMPLPQQLLGNVEQVDLAGALVDAEGAHVAVEALDAAAFDV